MQNTEKLLSFEEVKSNKEIIVPRIAEGNPLLEKIIMYCIDREIPTIACCNGHNVFDKPYITMHYDGSTRRNINAFLNKVKDIEGIEIMFSTTGYTENPFNVTVYTNMKNRDKVFKIIGDTLDSGLESEYLDDDLDAALDIAIDIDYTGRYSIVRVLNKRFRAKYMIGLYKACDGNIYEDNSDRKVKGDYGMTYYLYRTSKSVRAVASDLKDIIPVVRYRNGFEISMSSSTTEKVDRISELNRRIEEERGSIRRF
ncbi:MAG: hypothetical protein II119_01735 [Bacilli bacterium]|nr:hypothetical protein [Bacilli bacterium]